ncbi:MAG: dihydroorotase [bacterium]|uniref:Dihydroorotase n=2 Tax=Bacteria candidate phyla TaxID=1783234 RepID=A0A101I3T8_UNCT6|nr:MAG: Dihydroorotase [candidate division TA06 bacterium 32_111]KUK87884.1 MAG: Dihydroorotase [candidate division TA06 bacterium 34_109]MDI6700587.1 dihydroorotase [bacterium]HAF08037.1 dihydroorotase [candidate division WOR-3 bacterium]HCP16262.1 dihydroorotase [candidate division WOR-3 bacterium]
MNSLILKNCNIVNFDKIEKNKTVIIKNGVITSIENSSKDKGIDLKGKYLLPSFVDLHSHLREPGEEFKEDLFTGCEAALSGGYTSIVIMPNTKPPIDNPQSVTYLKKRELEFGRIEIFPLGALTKNMESVEITEMYDMLKAGAKGFSDDGIGTKNSRVFLNALRYISRFDSFISVHCEDRNLSEGGQINESDVSIKTGLSGIPFIEEDITVYRNLRIATYLKTALHIAHISTKDTLSLIKDFKKKNQKITCEVTPHHLIFDESVHFNYDTNLKVKPPLKSKRDVDSLVKGINDGSIDAIATDHAPHQIYEKEVEFIYAPFGIIGFETSFPSLYTNLVLKNKTDIKTLVKLLSYNPAKILNIDERYIKTGNLANLVVVDLEKEVNVDRKFIKSKSINTPFFNKKLFGSIDMTILKGRIVFRRD